MSSPRTEVIPLEESDDVVRARRAVRQAALDLGFGLVDQTRVVTATSELARNTVLHGGGGRMVLEPQDDGRRRGLKLSFEDDGPGIPDVEQALQDGWTSGGGLGLGLGGARRLSHEFEVVTEVGRGTRITVLRWG